MESSPSPANGGAVSTSNGGGEPGKLFVGGIPWDASEDALREYFGKYGDVTEAVIMRERLTGNARGFGFVSFSDPSSADKALRDDSANHAILGRPVSGFLLGNASLVDDCGICMFHFIVADG